MIDFILTKFQNLRCLGQFPTLLDPYRQRLLSPFIPLEVKFHSKLASFGASVNGLEIQEKF